MDKKYKLIVVDDEDFIREGIAKGIEWSKWGFEVAGTAMNGKEAIELVEKYKPDVVLTDIRMPIMDGIQLINYLDETNNKADIVIVSGYSDIEYYRKALEYHVFEYILKPTKISDFEVAFRKLKVKYDDKMLKHRKFLEMQELLNESIPYMKQNFLSNLVNGFYNKEEVEQKLFFFGFELETKGIFVCKISVEIEENDATNNLFIQEKKFTINNYIKNNFNKEIENVIKGTFFINVNQEVIGICNCDNLDRLISLFKKIILKLEERKNIYLLLGISNKCNDITEIQEYTEQARLALYQLVFFEENNVHAYNEINNTEHNCFLNELNEDKVINELLTQDGKNEIKEIERFFKCFKNTIVINYDYIDCICNKLYFDIVKYGLRFHINLNNEINNDFLSSISKIKRLNTKKDFLYQNIFHIKKIINQNKSNKQVLIIKIEKFIADNIENNELSLTLISDFIQKNPAYISVIYKNETGNNISDYIVNLRIDKAKELLKSTNLKNYEIGKRVGYNGSSYFTKIFKKIVGVSPSTYKKGR